LKPALPADGAALPEPGWSEHVTERSKPFVEPPASVVRADLRRPDELSQSRAVYARAVPDLRSRLLGAEQLVGSFLQLPLLPVCEVMAGCAGLDFLCVEGEHSGLSTSEIAAAVATLGLLKMPAVVRVAANDSAAIAFALDAGAEGVIVPRVESAKDATRASWAARYPPAGGRGVGPGRASGWGRARATMFGRPRRERLWAFR
jgi:HpcH/HpaI aldolase/citrate lyase family